MLWQVNDMQPLHYQLQITHQINEYFEMSG